MFSPGEGSQTPPQHLNFPVSCDVTFLGESCPTFYLSLCKCFAPHNSGGGVLPPPLSSSLSLYISR